MSARMPQAQTWLAFARRDLADAEVLATAGGSIESICFHAQEAAEKSLKALLVLRGQRVPRVHNLVALAERLMDPAELSDFARLLASLNRWVTLSRYPPEPGEDEPLGATPDAAIGLARSVVEMAVAEIEGSAWAR